jgi:hypothetical protein
MILFLKPGASTPDNTLHDFVPEAGGVDPGQWKTSQDGKNALT